MDRRTFLTRAGAAALLPGVGASCASSAPSPTTLSGGPWRRVRPGDASWPDAASWKRLDQQVGGQLVKVRSPLDACVEGLDHPGCAQFVRYAKNPYYLGDEVGLTQTLSAGWTRGRPGRASTRSPPARPPTWWRP